MSKEQECFNRIKLFINYMDDNFDSEDVKVVDKALKEYVSIKEVDPSAALECLEEIEQKLECYINGGLILLKDDEIKITTIKQALLKAEKEHNSVNLLMQELDCKDFAELRKYARCGYEKINKKYLKWEDFIFKHTPKTIDVKMGENKYTLVVGFNVTGCELVILRNKKQQYFFLEADKQFFNDLHLERVKK